MNDVEQIAVASERLALTLDELIEHVTQTEPTRQVPQAAQRHDVEPELQKPSELPVAARHASSRWVQPTSGTCSTRRYASRSSRCVPTSQRSAFAPTAR
jgi:hypothetical protein